MEEKQYYKEKRISSSSLKYFEQSPLLFRRFLDQEIDQEEKQYFNRGKQIHMAILEPKLFKKNYTYLDFETPSSAQQKQFCEDYIRYLTEFPVTDKIIQPDYALIEAYKNNYKTTSKDDKILEQSKELKDKLSKYIEYLQKRKVFKDILSYTDWNRIKTLKEQTKLHKLAKDLLYDDELSSRKSYNELVIFWEDAKYNLPCKSMVDRLVVDHDKKEVFLIDLKTANTFTNFKERCREFSYFRQMAFYWYAVTWWFLNELKIDISTYTKQTYIVALKTTEDPEVRVYSVSEQYLSEGFIELEEILNDLNWHWTNEKWDYTKKYYLGDGYEII